MTLIPFHFFRPDPGKKTGRLIDGYAPGGEELNAIRSFTDTLFLQAAPYKLSPHRIFIDLGKDGDDEGNIRYAAAKADGENHFCISRHALLSRHYQSNLGVLRHEIVHCANGDHEIKMHLYHLSALLGAGAALGLLIRENPRAVAAHAADRFGTMEDFRRFAHDLRHELHTHLRALAQSGQMRYKTGEEMSDAFSRNPDAQQQLLLLARSGMNMQGFDAAFGHLQAARGMVHHPVRFPAFETVSSSSSPLADALRAEEGDLRNRMLFADSHSQAAASRSAGHIAVLWQTVTTAMREDARETSFQASQKRMRQNVTPQERAVLGEIRTGFSALHRQYDKPLSVFFKTFAQTAEYLADEGSLHADDPQCNIRYLQGCNQEFDRLAAEKARQGIDPAELKTVRERYTSPNDKRIARMESLIAERIAGQTRTKPRER